MKTKRDEMRTLIVNKFVEMANKENKIKDILADEIESYNTIDSLKLVLNRERNRSEKLQMQRLKLQDEVKALNAYLNETEKTEYGSTVTTCRR